LRRGQTDEAELGMTYKELDSILQAIEHKQSLVGFKPEDVKRVQTLNLQAQHKLHLPPSLL
jgi:NAD+ synthase